MTADQGNQVFVYSNCSLTIIYWFPSVASLRSFTSLVQCFIKKSLDGDICPANQIIETFHNSYKQMIVLLTTMLDEMK